MERHTIRRHRRTIAGWAMFLIVFAACGGDSTPTTVPGSGDPCANAFSDARDAFANVFDEIEADPSRSEDVASSVEVDNLFFSLGAPLETACGRDEAATIYSDVLIFLSEQRSQRTDGAAPYVDGFFKALCEAGVFELNTAADAVCSS